MRKNRSSDIIDEFEMATLTLRNLYSYGDNAAHMAAMFTEISAQNVIPQPRAQGGPGHVDPPELADLHPAIALLLSPGLAPVWCLLPAAVQAAILACIMQMHAAKRDKLRAIHQRAKDLCTDQLSLQLISAQIFCALMNCAQLIPICCMHLQATGNLWRTNLSNMLIADCFERAAKGLRGVAACCVRQGSGCMQCAGSTE